MFGTQETKSIYQSFTNVLDATKQVVARCMHGSTLTDEARCALMSEFPSQRERNHEVEVDFKFPPKRTGIGIFPLKRNQ